MTMSLRRILARTVAILMALVLIGATGAYAQTHALPLPTPAHHMAESGHPGQGHGHGHGDHHPAPIAHECGDCVGCLGFAAIGGDPVAVSEPINFSEIIRYGRTTRGRAGPAPEPDPDPPRLSA